ncbi:MAG TPA: DUF6588 family protein [Bacteroidota bacterium]|nr:DUF6588 family protein [Bacteroidota bacterium]
MNAVPANRIITLLSAIVLVISGFQTIAQAQNPIEDAIQQLNSDAVRGYLQPMVTSVGADLNSGVFHSAEITDGISLKLELIAMGTLIGDAEKMYSVTAPSPFNQTPVQSATIFGNQGTIVHGPVPGIDYQFQNGQLKLSIVPLAVPQVTVGNFFGTQAVIRYVPIPEVNNFPKSTFFGIGVRHSISRYLPGVPVDLAGSVFYQKISIGDLMEEKTMSIGGQASKSFSLLTLYGGLQLESSTMTLDYTYKGYGAVGQPHIHMDIDGENNVRATLGLGLNLIILHVSGDVNFGNVTVVSGAVAFGI